MVSRYIFKIHPVQINVIAIAVYLRILLLICSLEINEDHPNEDSLFRACYGKLQFGRDSRTSRAVGMPYSEKMKAFMCALIGSDFHEVAWGQLIAGHFMWLVWGTYWTFSGPKLEAETKIEKLVSWPTPEHFGSIDAEAVLCLLGLISITVLSSYVVWPLYIPIVIFSALQSCQTWVTMELK